MNGPLVIPEGSLKVSLANYYSGLIPILALARQI